ncbi:MAG: hypothetical protein NT026_01535 [Candidatus Staskawiczbacteria bacterium]|nr:hypothetical protein [Candidatus Staskawiczbacteria bacterium]
MNYLPMIRDAILGVGWPVLIAGSIYLFAKGNGVYKLVKGSLIGKLTKVLVLTILVEMYSLGIVTTALMFCDERGIYLGLPVFLVWFVVFILTLKVLGDAQKEVDKMTGGQK